MASIKRDDVKQSWETTEFPLVCETCLGDNPYVRMTKEPHGKKCQVCDRPFTVFAWQAGTKGRLKRVEICRSCAQTKNVCQVCIYDLQYGLPVKVRDRILRENAGDGAGGTGPGAAVPQSHANRSWFTAQQERALATTGGGGSSSALTSSTEQQNPLAHAKLSGMAQMGPRYERNLPKICSFFVKGECDRGDACPFRHEFPKYDRNDPMTKQTTRDRFYGTEDPVANKMLGRKRKQEQREQKESGDGDGFNKARATVYVRFTPAVEGQPPSQPITEMEVRDKFYSFGEIVAVRGLSSDGHKPSHQAFVEYAQPEMAELAIASTNRKTLWEHYQPVFVAWARAPKHGDDDEGGLGEESGPQQQRRRGGGGSGPRGGHYNNNNTKPVAAAPNAATATAGDSDSAAPAAASATTTATVPKPAMPLPPPVMARPMAPPGAGTSSAPAAPQMIVKPPPEVAAIVAARQQQGGGGRSSGGVPRPGGRGGVPRPGGSGGVPRPGAKQPYYPSANPNRLGS